MDEHGQISTSIFRKPTDRNTLLKAQSFHPKKLISNIPFGQFQRLKRICSSENDFELQAKDMSHRFSQRGYDNKTINSALSKVRGLERRDLLKKRKRPASSNNKIFCSLQFSSMAHKIKDVIKRNWTILACDHSLGSLFSEPPTFAFKRPPTLKNKLVRNYLPAKRPTFFKKPFGTFRCGSCTHCSHINRDKTFTDSNNQRTFKCQSFANCNTTFVVYRIDCECGCFYVGRTKRKLKERFAEHKYAVRTLNMDYPVAKHFQAVGHTNINCLKVMVIETVEKDLRGGDRIKKLLQRETFWIDVLGATHYPGLNEEIDFSPYL